MVLSIFRQISYSGLVQVGDRDWRYSQQYSCSVLAVQLQCKQTATTMFEFIFIFEENSTKINDFSWEFLKKRKGKRESASQGKKMWQIRLKNSDSVAKSYKSEKGQKLNFVNISLNFDGILKISFLKVPIGKSVSCEYKRFDKSLVWTAFESSLVTTWIY